jgi:hypothetical protein
MDPPFYVLSSGDESSVYCLLSIGRGVESNKSRIVTRQIPVFQGHLMIPPARNTTSKMSRLSPTISIRQPKVLSQIVDALAMIRSMLV